MADTVAKAMPVKRSIKAIPNNSPWFLVILSEILLGLLYSCLFIFNRKMLQGKKNRKLLYVPPSILKRVNLR